MNKFDKNHNYLEHRYFYRYQELPLSQELQKLYVVGVIKTNEIVLSNDLSSENINNNFYESLEFNWIVQPILKNPKIGQECIALSKVKDRWGRAKILDLSLYDNNYNTIDNVLVYFVDYNTLELLSDTYIRCIRIEWLIYPVNNCPVIINIYHIKQKAAARSYLFSLLKNLIGKPIFVDIVSKSPYKVHLYDSNHQLYYQDLLGCEIVSLN